MEAPVDHGHEATRTARAQALQSIRPLHPGDVVRGQFRGYRAEPGVAPTSQVETFVAVRLYLDTPRWQGVPFYVRAGKCLPLTATEVMVQFKRRAQPVLDETDAGPGNYVRFRLGPEVVIALSTRVKEPGEAMIGRRVEMVVVEETASDMAPYERLLGDAAAGDHMLFAREDSVEAEWRAVEPVLDGATPLHEYEPNTWGPGEADALIPGGTWHNPAATETR
jgi:glucose-6-phosphate 1-dehydrogenase